MTIIIKDPQATFIHIPRTGGTSMATWLVDNAEGEYYHDSIGNKTGATRYLNYDKIVTLCAADNIDMGFTFTIVRNPWDRMVSSYKRWISFPHNNMPFDQFVIHPVGSVTEQMISFIGTCDYILEYEILKKDFGEIKKMFGCKKKLPHLRKSEDDRHYSAFYTGSSKRHVERRFAEDIEFFQYRFENA